MNKTNSLLLICLVLLPSLPLHAQTPQQPQSAPTQTPAAQPQTPAPAQPQVKEIVINPGTIPGVAPEYQEQARKSRRAREKVAVCQKEATDQKVLPRDRTKYVLDCIDRQPN
jgi:hypothetical protein